MKIDRITTSEIDLLDDKSEKKIEKQTAIQPTVKNKKLRLGGKKVCVGVSIISIALVWIVLLSPIGALTIQIAMANLTATTTVTNTIFNLLPPINVTSNYSNFTIERVECLDNFVYEPRDGVCYPKCNWNPSRDDSVRIVRLFLGILSVFSIVLCTTTLIAWLLLSCIDWKKFRFHYDFQLPRTSLFMVVMSSLFLVVLNASIDLTSRDFFFCQSTQDGQSYLLAQMFYSISNVRSRKIVTFVTGALSHYLFLVTISWIVISLINIIFIVFLPQVRKSFRKRILVFLLQCLICFGLNIIPVAIAIASNSDTPYAVVYLLNTNILLNFWSFLILFEMPNFLVPGIIISLTIVIIAKLRITSLESEETTGHSFKLTDLEKRLIVYGIVLMVLILVQGISSISLSFISPEYFQFVTKFILCITVNSPILTLPSNLTGSDATLNDTVPVYRENPYGDVDACRMFESRALELYPQFTPIIFTLLYRLIWLPIFFVLVPQPTVTQLRKWFKCLKEWQFSQNFV